MHRELITDPLDRDDMLSDLRVNIELLIAAGYTRALVFFGFAWGRYIYEGQWHDMPMGLDTLEKRIHEAEEKGYGRLGRDNLYFTIDELSIRLSYSHEADIHLSYEDENEIVTKIRERWLGLGWLTESLKSKSYQR